MSAYVIEAPITCPNAKCENHAIDIRADKSHYRPYGKGMGGVEDMVLRDRRSLAHDGIVLVIIAVEKLTGKIASGPDIISRGFVFEDASPEVMNDVKELVSNTLNQLDREIITDSSLLQAKIRSALKKYLRNTMDRRPMIMPIIYEV